MYLGILTSPMYISENSISPHPPQLLPKLTYCLIVKNSLRLHRRRHLLSPGLLFLHHRHFGPENSNSSIRLSGRTLSSRLLHRELVERADQSPVRFHLQLRPGDALRLDVYGLRAHLCQGQPEGERYQV